MVNGSIAIILKPPANFETVYQGKPRTTPIPFVEVNDEGEFSALDPLAGKAGVSSTLLRYVPLPIGSSLLVLIPVPRYENGGAVVSPAYLYDFGFRLRTVTDYNDLEKLGKPELPFSMVPTNGAPSAPAPTPRRVLPAYTTEQVTPALTGSARRPLIDASTDATVSQGVYDPANFAAAGSPTDGDLALGVTFFPPYLRPIVGNEFSINASFATGNWDFSSPTGDAAFSNLYGTNVAGPRHQVYPGVGIVLVVLTRNTTP